MIKLKEIYPAIVGEGIESGLPCVIVRLSGCNLRCAYCDTAYAYKGGRNMAVEALVRGVKKHGHKRVLVTGGEPLIQEEAVTLLDRLHREGLRPLLETNGSIDLRGLPLHVHVIMDLKTPGSGHEADNLWDNLEALKAEDEIKMVLTGRSDYLWARRVIKEHGLDARHHVTLSPAHGELDPARLARWILKDGLEVRLGLQIHKYVFPLKSRRV